MIRFLNSIYNEANSVHKDMNFVRNNKIIYRLMKRIGNMKKLLKDKILRSINAKTSEIIDFGEEIYNNPETGFKEFKTSKIVSDKFKKLGLECIELKDIPGVKATLDTGKEGPGVAIIGELDSVICREHPDCNKETGAVHACGHNVQLAAVLGAAIGILESGLLEELSGKIHLIAVPAEEFIEISFRKELREKGIIKYYAGKPEFLHRGLFDDVDMSMMVHTQATQKKFNINPSMNGCLAKNIRYIGKAAHAGAFPHEGINALYAANLGLSAINCLRETFQEEEYIRVHPIITKGGEIVNAIPSDVRMETFVRGKTLDSILNANTKVTRALIGGAVSMGAKVEIENISAYFPFVSDKNFDEVSKGVMVELVGEQEINYFDHGTGSLDLGDISTLMPVIHPFISGVKGGLHSAEFRITDPDTAYILSSKFLARTVLELLWSNAETAKDIINNFTPIFSSKEKYFEFVDKMFSTKVYSEENYVEE